MEAINDTDVVIDTNENSLKFEGILSSLSTLRATITMIQQQVRGLEKTITREQKVMRKEVAKRKYRGGNKKPSGFATPTKISDELCKFMSEPEGAEVARTEVTRYIIKYIKDNELQNPENRRIIMPNDELKELLGSTETDEVNYFNIQKFMNRHFHKKQTYSATTTEEHVATAEPATAEH
jgi:chromatin remodeling complex protein RSC6